MQFSDSQSYMLVIEPMSAEYIPPRSYSWEWKYRLFDREFYKCLYLAAFMQKNKFPVPKRIIILHAENQTEQSALQSASAIKYAMGTDWKDVFIDNSYGFTNKHNNINSVIDTSARIHKDDKFNLIIADNALRTLSKYNKSGSFKTGEAILFSGNNLMEISANLMNGQDVDFKFIECDQYIIPSTSKLSDCKDDFDGILDKNPNDDVWRGFNGDYDEEFYQKIYSKIIAGKGSISNKFPLMEKDYENTRAKRFFEFVQTFKKEPYKFR